MIMQFLRFNNLFNYFVEQINDKDISVFELSDKLQEAFKDDYILPFLLSKLT